MTAVSLLLFAMSSAQAGPPPDQSFHFGAHFNMSSDTVSVTVGRTIRTMPRRMSEPVKTFAPYRWSVPAGSVRADLVPISNQVTAPRVIGLEKALAFNAGDPASSFGAVDIAIGTAKVDWTGCKPGFYRLDAAVLIHGENRRWTMRYDHQVYYWRPMPKQLSPLRPGQEFLMVQSNGERYNRGLVKEIAHLYGTTLTLEAVGKENERRQTPVAFESQADGRIYRSETSFDGRADDCLVPVFRDEEARMLRGKYLNKVAYPTSNYLALQTEPQGAHLHHLKRGEASLRVLDVWRASQQQHLGSIDPYLLGGNQHLLSGWYPLFVVFETTTPELKTRGRSIAVFADAWAVERALSLTSMSEDFKDWKPQPNGPQKPIRPEEGFTHKQVAWVWQWPNAVRSYAETLKMTEWGFTHEDKPAESMRFVNGRLVK
jgi:hypothetical protein